MATNSRASADAISDAKPILGALRALGRGDFAVRLAMDQTGMAGAIAEAFNDIAQQVAESTDELDRISVAVGKEGKIDQRLSLGGATGGWADRVHSVNSLIGDLVEPTLEVARVIGAVARGDLSQKMTPAIDGRPLRGAFLWISDTVNTMVDQLGSFASEVTRVAREVGTEGKLGGQADVQGVAGTWKDLTDSVNSMAGNLTAQVRNIADVTKAVANGDLSKKVTVDVRGEILELKNTVNTMVDQLGSFASEVTRVAREVGTEGKLGGQADVKGVAGTWKDLTDSVNSMAGNLTAQVRNIANVTKAVANGDLSKKVTVDVKGEILELKDTVNTMVDQLSSFASEVTRVAREVGTEGKLGGQADVRGVAGTWKDLTDNVNIMADNLTTQVRNIAEVTTAVARGDLSRKITVDVKGEILELKNTVNTMVDQLGSFASEVTRVAREVGTEGRLGGKAVVRGVAGTWKDLTDNVNIMADNLTTQVRNIADVNKAVANGDLSKKITVDVKGEILELKNTVNTMVDQLSSFASEVTRVAREVGTEGKLGGQADVKGVAGIWEDLTDNVNMMAANLTSQVRGIAKVVTAVANGDLKRKLTVEAQGEIADLADTINEMIDTLATFADQVTTVAREVGVEGRLGGQASVPGAAGTWKDLTDNVNQLAANLSTQVRAIAEVATAVTQGDLTRSIKVEAKGEVSALKDNINEMIRNLRETTRKNTEQDWLKTNLTRFTRLLQGQKDLMAVAKLILSELAPVVAAQHGAFYLLDSEGGAPILKLLSSYAFQRRKHLANRFSPGEGLVGQCVLEKEQILLTELPDDYTHIVSGLGGAPPRNLIVLPVLFEDEVKAVLELASFNRFTEIHLTFLEQLAESLGIVLNTIAASMRTEELLKQSQTLAGELQSQQEELRKTNERLEKQADSLRESEELLKKQREQLQQTNEELEEKAELQAKQKAEVEAKNREIEGARRSLQEKAEQLTLASRYKSQFLANMSHELRTPLNSLLILTKMLAENPEGNLTAKQVEFAGSIHASGSDLLALISDILDMSKIESGTVVLEVGEFAFDAVREFVERTFRQVAQEKGLRLRFETGDGLPEAMTTDQKRFYQVLKNLLSNALKFTEEGEVVLRMERAEAGWSRDHEVLDQADSVVAFSVIDSGIGIPEDKRGVIFEPFQQVDMSSTRRHGGTGLGLSVSREIAQMLGGEIRVVSTLGKGSTFTLYLPRHYRGTATASRLTTTTGTRPRAGRPPAPSGTRWPARADERLAVPDEEPALFTTDAGAATTARSPAFTTDARAGATARSPAGAALAPATAEVADDRHDLGPGERIVLVIEDDARFARILLDMAHRTGFKGLVASRGDAGLELARRYGADAIMLDIKLPGMEGWAVLDRLKHSSETRHIPVHIISVQDDLARGLRLGAIACLQKPVSAVDLEAVFAGIRAFLERDVRTLLIVEDDPAEREGILKLIGDGDVRNTAVGTAREALNALQAGRFDCVVLDLRLPDMGGLELIETIRKRPNLRELPIVVYAAEDMVRDQARRLEELAESVIIKGEKSPERLLDETALFLHRVEANLPESKRRLLREIRGTDPILAGRKVLIVDDDARNLFALTSLLERQQMHVLVAENGNEAIAVLDQDPDVDLVLMDIMMPEMDGYEAMRAIRQIEHFQSLPLIALTAKAMKGDRETCVEAGASDYIGKPVDTEQLLSLLRVWLYR
jgi:CheY-like chemotaxis protein/signal transduction histidine kinase/HAMP domain-containing protein